MRTRRIWLGIGSAVLAGTPVAAGASPAGLAAAGFEAMRGPVHPAQHGGPPSSVKAGGEGEGEGGGKADAGLPPALIFNRGLQLIRGHLRVGAELVDAGRWQDALPHFLHPTEEIYGRLRADLKTYDVPPFETALKALAQTIKAKNREAYARARATVEERLAVAERGVRAKVADPWPSFALETAMEMLRVAGDEYANALDGTRVKLPVEYQDSRGFVFEAERAIEAVSGELATRDAEALAVIRSAFADLKTAWPGPMPPRVAARSVADVLADMSRVELQVGRFR